MVTSEPEKRPHAEYSLAWVAQLATRQSVQYASTRVTCDVDALGYVLDDVCACLAGLQSDQFSHSERYRPDGTWHDVYRTSWALPGRRSDEHYLKFRMSGNRP